MLFSLQEFFHTPSSAFGDDTLSPFLHLIPPVIHIWLFATYNMLKDDLVTLKASARLMTACKI